MQSDTTLRLPAEWEPQQQVLLTWPRRDGDWDEIFEPADRAFLTIAGAIRKRCSLTVSCSTHEMALEVNEKLAAQAEAPFPYAVHTVPANDVWVRDHGPIGIYRAGKLELCDFRFNGWGNKYPASLDDEVSARLYALGTFQTTRLHHVDHVLEGGAIDSDGQGTLLTTTHCLLRREAGSTKAYWEQQFNNWFGISRVLWLDDGALIGDDTDGHVDTLARFCDTRTITYTSCVFDDDPHFAPLKMMESQLRSFTTTAGSPYRLLPLPIPRSIYDDDGRRLAATYANFLITNGAVLVPTYDDAHDRIALEQLAIAFPGHELVPIDSRALIHQNGSIHCASMQVPQRTESLGESEHQ